MIRPERAAWAALPMLMASPMGRPVYVPRVRSNGWLRRLDAQRAHAAHRSRSALRSVALHGRASVPSGWRELELTVCPTCVAHAVERGRLPK